MWSGSRGGTKSRGGICNKMALGSAGLGRVVVRVVGGRPARVSGSTCRPCDEVRGSGVVAVLWVWAESKDGMGESGVGSSWESVRIGVFPAGARAHLRM